MIFYGLLKNIVVSFDVQPGTSGLDIYHMIQIIENWQCHSSINSSIIFLSYYTLPMLFPCGGWQNNHVFPGKE